MTVKPDDCLTYTLAHFREIARRNRFAENAAFPHDAARCVVCHPELLPMNPLAVYLEVVTESIKVRRPCLDQGLLGEINADLKLAGDSREVSMESLLAGEPTAVALWSGWVREALETGLGLLSVHSPTSREFSVDDPDQTHEEGRLVEAAVERIMAFQRQNSS